MTAPGTAEAGRGAPSGVRATARVTAAPDGRGGTALPVLTGEGPLALRRVRADGGWARALLVGAMGGPLGGDRLTVRAHARPGARLGLGSAAATLALPGQSGEAARYDVRLTADAGAELRWLPEQLIVGAGSDLAVATRADVAPGARLVLREEQVLGRTGDAAPGRLTSGLRLRVGEQVLLEQELTCGPGAPGGWDGPAVLGGHRALGQLLVVRPEFTATPPVARLLGDHAALTPLAGPAVLVQALGRDALEVRRVLDGALAELDAPDTGP
ncbi:urease accessory protein UreD [Streptomyces sp. Z26]|uniref:urease accessory protein UreD n=1 Tax=Streptomyces sp. Z26 TaxID=2500177 RepID=UPI000EF1467D|nr:urease accessory protein UreD [Streptomyces sp. Z26]RLL69823.1 urease accessory protein UreD [Streptomyces sp. Z26]